MFGLPRAIVVILLLGCAAPVAAQQREADAKEAFFAGKAAYEAKRFEEALDQFKRCYTLGGQPALLYNIASTLQNLNRPGDAADTLREFLKVRPGVEDRAEIEARIATLDRAQQLMNRDTERKRKLADEEAARRKRELELDAAQHPGAGWLTEADANRRLELHQASEHRRRKRTLALALGVTFGGLALGGVVVGVVCGLGKCGNDAAKDFDYAKITVTR